MLFKNALLVICSFAFSHWLCFYCSLMQAFSCVFKGSSSTGNDQLLACRPSCCVFCPEGEQLALIFFVSGNQIFRSRRAPSDCWWTRKAIRGGGIVKRSGMWRTSQFSSGKWLWERGNALRWPHDVDVEIERFVQQNWWFVSFSQNQKHNY